MLLNANVADEASPKPTVLVVDDEQSVRLLISEILADLGFESVEAEDGAAGMVHLLSSKPIHLLITDIGLPGGMNGNQLAQAARTVRPGLAILIITGYAQSAVSTDLPPGPGTIILSKPFTLDDLAVKIRELIP